MDGMKIESFMLPERGDVRPLAEHILQRALAWFEDPEHEREYQEWKKERDRKRKAQ